MKNEVEELIEKLTKKCNDVGEGSKYLFNVKDVNIILRLVDDQNKHIQRQHLKLLDIQQLSHMPLCHKGSTPRVVNMILANINNRCSD